MRSRPGTLLAAAAIVALSGAALLHGQDKAASGVTVDKEKKTVTIACKVAPRKLPNLKQIYPIEVIATWPAPRGQKAHETVVTLDAKPSDVHKALESVGLKAGSPGRGQVSKAAGPELRLFLEVPSGDGTKRIPIEEALTDTKSEKPLPPQKWLFTGSAFKNPDPEQDDKVYGADMTGTLITIFPVTDDTVIQAVLGAADEGKWRLEVNKAVVPAEGTAVKLVIQAK